MSSHNIIMYVQRGNLKAIDRLLESISEHLEEEESVDYADILDAVIEAVDYGNLKIVQRFLEESWIDFSDIPGILVHPAQNGNLEMLDLILRNIKPPPQGEYDQALIEASKYGHLEVVERLLKTRSNPSVQNNRPLIMAVMGQWGFLIESHWEVIRLLLRDDRVLEPYLPYLKPI